MGKNRRKKKAKLSTRKIPLLAEALDELDWAIIDECLRNPCITDTELGTMFGCTRSTANRRRTRPRVRAEMAQLARDSIAQTRELIAKSLNRAGKILDHGNDTDAKSIALKFINGLPEIATGVLKPEHD